ncbi:MAG: adenosylcobinamide-GDP ribazoletransferase, partial [Cyanobacteria bacterium J06560_2]
RWVPWVGGVIGALMAIADWSFHFFQVPALVASALTVSFGIALTGGLHLDGVMDAADGLAVPDPSRRLAVMSDSRMGAFGGMAVVVLILLKVSALSTIAESRWFVLISVSMWGRWAQQWAIARYPYLKKAGKGAFHKAALPTPWQTLPSLLGLISLSAALWFSNTVTGETVIRTVLGGIVFSGLTNTYFVQKLGGHTGDTYGAVVEWTEALLLCSLSVL